MTQYKVIYPFRDLQDKGKTFPNGREYAVGDEFPATKRDVSEERISELSGTRNKIGRKLIERVGDKGGVVKGEEKVLMEKGEEVVPLNSDYPRHTGGGYYELSNGEKVKGKAEAQEAEEKLGD